MKKFAFSLFAMMCVMSAGCSMRGFKPPAENWEAFVRQDRKVSVEEVKRELLDCGFWPAGYSSPPGQATENDAAARMECMFAKGYVLGSGWGGFCSEPDRHAALPACANAPIRPRYR